MGRNEVCSKSPYLQIGVQMAPSKACTRYVLAGIKHFCLELSLAGCNDKGCVDLEALWIN